MNTDPLDFLDVQVAYAQVPGYHVVVDVELPVDALGPLRQDGGCTGSLRLSANDAEALAVRLTEIAGRVRTLRSDQV
jgi:hypothetical protein